MTPTTPSDEETASLFFEKDPVLKKFHVRPETAAYNKALLELDLTDEDEPTTKRWALTPIPENWPGQLRTTDLPMWAGLILVALSPIILTLIWTLSQ